MYNTYIISGIGMSSVEHINVCLLALILYYSYMNVFSWEKTENHYEGFFVLCCESVFFKRRKKGNHSSSTHIISLMHKKKELKATSVLRLQRSNNRNMFFFAYKLLF